MADILISLGDKYSLIKSREELAQFPYFRHLMEYNPNDMQFLIPENPHLEQMYFILTNARLPALNIEDTFKYLRANTFLGRDNKSLIIHLNEIVNSDADLLQLLRHFPALSEMRLIPQLADIAGRVVAHYIVSGNIPDSLSAQRILNLISILVPHMTVFSYAIEICLYYNIDCNLVTASPTINDIYNYAGKRLDEICQIYEYNDGILGKFLSYFDDYTFLLRGRDRTVVVQKDGENFPIPGNIKPSELPNPFMGYSEAREVLKQL